MTVVLKYDTKPLRKVRKTVPSCGTEAATLVFQLRLLSASPASPTVHAGVPLQSAGWGTVTEAHRFRSGWQAHIRIAPSPAICLVRVSGKHDQSCQQT